jgi:5'/3'-nucleotidase SurE
MRILLTNDDGINAPGLKVLEEIARQFSDDIWICAPSEEQSGAGHSLTLTRPVRLHQHGERRFAVSGTPTDSVMMALRTVMPDAPDVILSGVNRGANLADDITYSGTVSAAIEGALAKLPQTKVRLKVLSASVGAISENDVLLAAASKAIVIGFNVRPDSKAQALADSKTVPSQLFYYSITTVAVSVSPIIQSLIEEVGRRLE